MGYCGVSALGVSFGICWFRMMDDPSVILFMSVELFFSVFEQYLDITLIIPQRRPSKFFKIHHSSYHLTVYGLRYWRIVK
jgi:hypothetical protein